MQDIDYPGEGPLVLLFHGLGGNPMALQLVAQRLAAAGHAVRVPYLPGYGHSPEDCSPVPPHETWEAMAMAQLDRALAEPRCSVVVGGIGIGADLALHLALMAPERVSALLLISTTLFYDGWSLPWYRSLLPLIGGTPLSRWCRVRESHPFGVKNHRIREWIAHQMESTGHSVAGARDLPLSALCEAWRMMCRIRRQLPAITAPALILHAAEDEMASLRTPDLLAARLGSVRLEKRIYTDSYHRLTLDNDRYAVAQACVDFLSGYGGAAAGTQPLAA